MTKKVNIYIIYDLDAWSKNLTNNFKFRNCLLGSTDIVKNSDKEKYIYIYIYNIYIYIYSGYGITCHSESSWSSYNETTRNVIILGADNSLSSHPDNRKNNFLVLGEGPISETNGSFSSPEGKFSINFKKSNTKCC